MLSIKENFSLAKFTSNELSQFPSEYRLSSEQMKYLRKDTRFSSQRNVLGVDLKLNVQWTNTIYV